MNFIDLPSFFQQNMYTIIIVLLVFGGIYIYSFVRYRKMKTSSQDYAKNHPDAVKIFLTTKALITSEAVSVHSVDGEGPELFTENLKTGFFVFPGNRIVEMSYTFSRPGILYKNVTQTIGPVKKELLVENGKEYLLDFDRENESFIFKEL